MIDADEYLGQLSRYIHLNPVRAGMVTTVEQYPWSSYPAFIGKTKVPAWLETGRLLGYLGKQKKRAIRNYRNFVEGIDAKTLEDPGKDVVGGFILGDSDFVGWVRETFLSKMEDKKEIPQLGKLKSRPSLKKILQAVCDEFRCSEEDILVRGRKKNKAREIAIYLARDFSGLSCKEVGTFFNSISGAAITMRYKQVAKDVASDKSLRRKVNRLRKHLTLKL
ncbi:MAG: helix-turn-helix domain-containing protein [Nitrospirota bacterium]|nr:helix-turn-helix domain-containing protein [Nitrospirota bacterium]